MKRIAIVLAALSLIATTAGAAPLKVVTTIQDLASLTKEVGDDHPLGNPHFWLDPANAVRIAIQIQQKLAELRPADAPYFAQRLNAFKIRINEANKRWLAVMAPYRGAKVVTYHRSWPNFAKHFGLDVVDSVEPKPGVPTSPSDTFDVINSKYAQYL